MTQSTARKVTARFVEANHYGTFHIVEEYSDGRSAIVGTYLSRTTAERISDSGCK